MNTQHLRSIFANYIRKFEHINSPSHNENYKWRIAAGFHSLIDPNAPNFTGNIAEALKLSSNLIDCEKRYCFSALVTCAQKDEEAVRALFRDLFAEDGGDLTTRQEKILAFIARANELTKKHHSSNGMFMNDQRSTMGYLFFNDPDHHYLFKSSEASSIASCIEFYDDWRSGADFNLAVYYRMCDLIIEEIRRDNALLETHRSRYFAKDGSPVPEVIMHPDKNFHILVFDIIYGAPEFRYNFYEGIPFTPITAQARKLHQERKEKTRLLLEKRAAAQAGLRLYDEAIQYYASLLPIGGKIRHKAFGEGTVIEYIKKAGGDIVKVKFDRTSEIKSFTAPQAITGGFLLPDAADLAEKNAKYRNIIGRSRSSLQSALEKTEAEYREYEKYLK